MDYAQFVFFIKPILFFDFCAIMLYYKNSHGQNEVNQVKKQTLVPLITFLLGICLISLIVYKTDTHEKEQRHITAQLNVATYGEQIKNEITNGIEITDTLKQILISEDGEIHQFETIVGNLMSDSIESVQLAPNGVVTDIYPANGNEAGKIDLIHDKDRGKISCYARDNHTIITQGPFKLKQGGYGIAVRNPVYLKDKNGHEYFWGFTIVILRVPDIFSDSISALSNFGYEYKISKTDAPWSDTYKVVYQSDGQINRPVSYTFTIGDENWKFEVTPKSGWRNATLLIIIIGIFLTISLLLSVLTRVWLVAKEHKKKFQILARTDSLTNIYNRYGFDEFAEKMIQKNPKTHFVAALLDIDDFKFINDIYGHNYGDRALKNLADSMKTFFPSDALLGRNGGDEFCILLPNCTFAEAAIQLQKFTKLPKSFSYHGKEHAFYISLGYAEYPTFASNRSQLMRCADAALYEIKLHGKNGCMVYREGLRSGARNTGKYFMYCSWIGKICIFVTMINSQDKILQKTERIIYFHIMFMSASSIKRKSTLLLREATRSFIFRSATTFPGSKHLRENAFLGFRFEMLPLYLSKLWRDLSFKLLYTLSPDGRSYHDLSGF